MTEPRSFPLAPVLRRASARLHLHLRALLLRVAGGGGRNHGLPGFHLPRLSRHRGLRKLLIGAAAVGVALALAAGAVWWRLADGPLTLDIATPWLTAALEERFGNNHRVEVGGTVLERDEDGGMALRLHDIVVRDADGTVVATAPKAEVGVAGVSLLTGHIRAQRLSLIGANMALRVERDGQVTIFAGADGNPFATAAAGSVAPPPSAGESRPNEFSAGAAATPASEPSLIEAVLGWVQRLDAVGLDGKDLVEIGLKSGSIAVDDRRSGRKFTFANINLSLRRPREGGVALAVSSTGADGPWSMNATMIPRGDGRRSIEAVIRDVSPKDIMLALRVGIPGVQADVPISAVIRAEIGPDGAPQGIEGRIIAGAGYIGSPDDRETRLLLDEAQVELRWDAASRSLLLPIDIQSGVNRIMLAARVEPPRETGGRWSFSVGQGTVLLAPLDRSRDAPLVLDRVSLRGTLDPANRRLELQQGDLRGVAGGLAVSGAIDYSEAEPRLMLGIAGTRMSMSAFKRLWPGFVAPPVRSWVEQRVQGGFVERVDIAVNAPLPALQADGPPLADDALSIDIVAKGTSVRPVDKLPVVRDTDLTARVKGRSATVSFSRGTAELPSGRKLTVSGGVFEVADTAPKAAPTRTRFRLESSMEAAAELLALEPLRDAAAVPIDPASTRGSVSAQVTVGLPLNTEIVPGTATYAVEAEVSGFAAERFIRGQKAEAALLRVSATQQALQIRGDMKIAGMPAAVEFRKLRGEPEAEIRLQATLDDAGRARMGLEFGNALAGPVPVKLHGRMKSAEREGRMAVEADLTQAKITELIPGWNKPAGRPGRATFVMVDKGQATRLEDLTLDSSGLLVKGAIELDADGDILNVNFPTFALSEGDKASLKAERAPDGTLRVVLRGDLYDGRGFVKAAVAGQKPERRRPPTDIDLDIKLGAVAGHHGETLRSLELRLARRAGQIRSLSMSGKLGQDSSVVADLRTQGPGRQVIYLETNDAGALFRLTDTYPRIIGGHMTVAMDPPTADLTPQEGLLNIQDFAVRGEPALDRVAYSGTVDGNDRTAARAPGRGTGVAFSRMRVDFTRSPGRFIIRDGVVWGPSIGATVEGILDYGRDEVHLKGTFVPAYALNNMFSRLPIVGLFLGGGSNEGLLGITYQVVGSPQAPVLQVNPMSAVAPGFLRKLFEFRGAGEQTGRPPDPVR